ncbi:MAG: acyl carrier protein [Acetobacteraceae bacterium]|nr:acyl carrier protein [Acetobacteraceae bacterium]
MLEGALAAEAARVLGLAAQAVERTRPLADLGMDSLMAVEFGLAVESRLGGSLPAITVAGGVTIADLAARLLPVLRGDGVAGHAVAIAAVERPGAEAAKRGMRAGE